MRYGWRGAGSLCNVPAMPGANEPIAPHLRRALLWIKLANDGGVYPLKQQLDQYAVLEEPLPAQHGGKFAQIGRLAFGPPTAAQPVADYPFSVGWIKENGSGICLTQLGEGLAAGLAAEGPSRTPTSQVFVLTPDNPARYELLTRAIGNAKEGLLADPYLRAENIDWIVDSTNLARVLVAKKLNKTERALIGFALGRLSETDQPVVEVRVTDDEQFHDRYLLHRDGHVDMIGASLNGIDKNVTAIMPLPDQAQPAVRRFVEGLWSAAEPITPRRAIKADEPVSDPL
jgi:hypothetical protein